MNVPSSYVLATGAEAARRLAIVDEVHGPDTRDFLRRAGLRPGMRVADIGCGTGKVSKWIASEIGPAGQVHGVDISARQIEEAKSRVSQDGPRNLNFELGTAEMPGLSEGTYDLVFSRFVLMHTTDPLRCLRAMLRLLRPEGVLAVEDGDFTSPFCWPPSAAFERCFKLYRALGERRGQRFLLGRELHTLVCEAGAEVLETRLAQPALFEGEAKRLPEWTIEECLPAILKAGLASEEEVRSLVAEMGRLAEDSQTIVGMARMMQVVARRPIGDGGAALGC